MSATDTFNFISHNAHTYTRSANEYTEVGFTVNNRLTNGYGVVVIVNRLIVVTTEVLLFVTVFL